jgi:hypothetical protein
MLSSLARRGDGGLAGPAILVELGETRVSIGASASASLVTATLRALR